jgi:DNA-binding response OmpR family regulator
MRVLVIEDDQMLARVVERALGEDGHAVEVSRSVEEGCRLASSPEFDVILLDLTLPDGNGLEVLRAARQAGRATPVLIITGHGEDERVVRGLDAGADDYIKKPVSNDVLKARIRAAVRRGGPGPQGRLALGELVLDRLTRQVHAAGTPIPLTPKEFAMLEYLLLRPGEVVPRAELLEHVWNVRFDPGSNVVDAHMARLRAKLRKVVTSPDVRTVRGVGFVATTQPG